MFCFSIVTCNFIYTCIYSYIYLFICLLDLTVSGDLCADKEHGEFGALKECFEEYYRCVWGKAVRLKCPQDTVYNPVWSACDYKQNVESCKSKSYR